MPCLFVLFAAFAPRVLLVIMWLARPNLMDAAFQSVLIPILGLIFLPFTTVMWVVLWAATGQIDGLDWVWLFIAVLLDLSHWVTSAANRRRMPGMGSAAAPAAAAAAPMMSTTGAVPMTPPPAAPVPAPMPEAPAPAPMPEAPAPQAPGPTDEGAPPSP